MIRDDFNRLLLAAYQGPGGTEEGPFAGDVLRACADGLERRAFVATAVDECLTMVCADRGRTTMRCGKELWNVWRGFRPPAMKTITGSGAAGRRV